MPKRAILLLPLYIVAAFAHAAPAIAGPFTAFKRLANECAQRYAEIKTAIPDEAPAEAVATLVPAPPQPNPFLSADIRSGALAAQVFPQFKTNLRIAQYHAANPEKLLVKKSKASSEFLVTGEGSRAELFAGAVFSKEDLARLENRYANAPEAELKNKLDGTTNFPGGFAESIPGYDMAVRNAMLEHSAFSFVNENPDSSVAVQMVVQVRSHDGKQHAFQQAVPHTTRKDWASLKVSQFHKMDPESPSLLELLHPEANKPSYLSGVGFSFAREANAGPVTLPFRVEGVIGLDIDLPNKYPIAKILGNQLTDSPNFYQNFPLVRTKNGVRRVVPREEVEASLNDFFRGMNDPASQAKAVAVINKGLEETQKELARFGWRADNVFDGKVTLFDVMENLGLGQIPRETGSFGDLHGPLAHQAQVLAGLYGMKPGETDAFKWFLQMSMSRVYQPSDAPSRTFANWPLWSMLFDARGESVHGNRFWRDLIERSRPKS